MGVNVELFDLASNLGLDPEQNFKSKCLLLSCKPTYTVLFKALFISLLMSHIQQHIYIFIKKNVSNFSHLLLSM